jgi:hypothetical protein
LIFSFFCGCTGWKVRRRCAVRVPSSRPEVLHSNRVSGPSCCDEQAVPVQQQFACPCRLAILARWRRGPRDGGRWFCLLAWVGGVCRAAAVSLARCPGGREA